jgi:flagellar biosynthesis GTPase FlhF
MTTITVTAGDTAQAMDKIVERLGEDAMILETVKRNGRIEMIATDDPGEAAAPAAPEMEVAAPRAPLDLEIGSGSAFTDLFDQQMISRVRHRNAKQTSAAENLVGRTIDAADSLEVLTELKSIRKMLNGMMITRPEGLDVTLGHAAPVRLYQSGFSPQAIQAMHHHMVGLDDDRAVMAFMDALANKVVHPDVDALFDSRLVLVVGSSGTGKTTLATKIAAYFKEHGISERMTLAAATGPGVSVNEDIKSYARLLNIRSLQFGIGELKTIIQETSNRIIVDINATAEDAQEAVRDVIRVLGIHKVTVVQAIPGGSSATMISHQCRQYGALKPMIALTKLDECEAMPAELSALALEGSGVGLLTGTKAIVGGIAIATMPILAQYLRENANH